jgi:hypothetical protein
VSDRALKLTRHLVQSKARQLFPGHAPDDILLVLDEYGAGEDVGDRERVQLAILKLSEGDPDKLRHYADVAKSDFRDVLAWAEYPHQSCHGFGTLDAKTRLELERKDLQQYLDWLNSGDESGDLKCV